MASRALTIVFAVVAIAGCGSSAEPPTPPRPTLPVDVAGKLATQSDKVASALLAGDSCGALAEAQQLQRDTIAAISRVPAAFREELSGTVNDLVSRIVCVRVEEGEEENEGKGRGKGKGKGKGKRKGDD